MTEEEEKDMIRMVREIYYHLGLDCRKVVSMKSVGNRAQKDVLKWKEKQLKKGYERAITEGQHLAD